MATLILNATQLQAMEDDLTADYELGLDIEAGATKLWNGGEGFDPIGGGRFSPKDPFTGSFDGKGYTINDLYISRPDETNIGLFGYTGNGCGTIQNVGLVDCNITGQSEVGALIGFHDDVGGTVSKCFSSGSVSGVDRGYIGGLIGTSWGPLEDCYSICTVANTGGAEDVSSCGGLAGTVQRSALRCFSTSTVTITSDGDIQGVGGFTGYHTSYELDIERCYSTGALSVTAGGRAKNVGGFIGNSYQPITDCYARGDVTVSVGDTSWGQIGGFVGDVSASTVDNCYSTGSITETLSMPDIGGFCGDNSGTISNCFWDTQTSGETTSDGGTGKTTAQMKTKATFTDAGWVFYGQFDVETPIWHITTNRNNGYPILPAQGFGHGWIEGNYFAFIAELGKQKILGTDTTVDAVAGYGFIEVNAFHYLDSSGDERQQTGGATGATGDAGQGYIDDLRVRYIDSSGNIRYLGTWILGSSKLGVDTILHA